MGVVYTDPPQSRNEAILDSIIDGTQYTDPPQSRIEDLLLQVKEVIEEGGHDESATRASIAPTESDSAHASTSYKVGEQFYLADDKLYTATSAIAQNAAIIVYPTANYNCKLSPSVTTQITSGVESAYQLVEDTVGWKFENFIDSSGWESKEVNGVTFTVNNDGSISLSGTSTGDISYYIVGTAYNDYVAVPNEMKGIPLTLTGGQSVGCQIRFAERQPSTIWHDDNGEGVTFTLNPNTTTYNVHIHISNGKNCNGIVLRPCIAHASVEESKADNSVIGPVENGTNPTKSYAVGEHMTRNGKYCTVTVPVTTASTWALNGNYTEGSVGDIVYIEIAIPEMQITAGGVTTFNLGSNITFSSFDILSVSVMVGGSSAYLYAIAQWVYSSVDALRICIHNLDAENAYSWSGKALLTLRIK